MRKSLGKYSEGACVHGSKEKYKMGIGSHPSLSTAITTGNPQMHISVKFDTMVASVANFSVREWRNVSNDTPEVTILLGHFPLQYCDYIVEMYFYLLLLDFLLEE